MSEHGPASADTHPVPAGRLKARRGLQIERHVLAGAAYEILQRLVVDQVLPPDARVSIDLLALELGVSQTPIREALARLEGDGLVIKRTHGRYWTTPMLTIGTFEHLYDTRLQLEPFAAGEAARHIDRKALKALREALDDMAEAGTGGEYSQYGRFAAKDALFHEVIALASDNAFLAKAIQRLHSHMQLSRLYREQGVIDAPEALSDHRAILDALERRDPDGASRGMHQHIERSRRRLRRLVAASADGARHEEPSSSLRSEAKR